MSIVPSPPANATPTARGLMSAADKSKLDGIPEGGGSGVVEAVTQANGLTLTTGTLAMGAAGAASAGAVTTGAQEFAGAKTLTGAILNGVTTIAEAVTSLVRAVGASLVLRSSLGAGASDVAVKVGTSETDAGTNATAKLLSVRTGLGGTEVESLAILKGGVLQGGLGSLTLKTGTASTLAYGTTTLGVGINITLATTGSYSLSATGYAFSTATGVDILNGLTRSFRTDRGGTSGHVCMKSGTSVADGSVSPTAYLHQFITGSGGTEVVKAQVSTGGEWEQLTAGAGVILKSPDGTRWRITVDNTGALAVAAA